MTLQNELDQFCGTLTYHRYSRKLVLTDGAKYLAENAGCFWFVDIIQSVLPAIHATDFLSVKLEKLPNDSAIVTITDGNEDVLYKQDIEYTDFPLDSAQVFVQNTGDFWVMMLTSEY